MICSLNEIEVYSRRATRGAGLPWGLAEEAGKATRWLATHNLPAPALLAKLLTSNDQRKYEDMAPIIRDCHWHAPQDTLCPLRAGTALSDRIDDLIVSSQIVMQAVACPLLLTPFLRDCRYRERVPDDIGFELHWADVAVSIFAGRIHIDCDGDDFSPRDDTPDVTIRACRNPPGTADHRLRTDAVYIDDPTWQTLHDLAQRTYVVASAQSRALGAG